MAVTGAAAGRFCGVDGATATASSFATGCLAGVAVVSSTFCGVVKADDIAEGGTMERRTSVELETSLVYSSVSSRMGDNKPSPHKRPPPTSGLAGACSSSSAPPPGEWNDSLSAASCACAGGVELCVGVENAPSASRAPCTDDDDDGVLGAATAATSATTSVAVVSSSTLGEPTTAGLR